ncbi:SH3 domain-containing protein [Sulfitobacter aestuarii]|uniref:SH3 domain-containing protein n=1 Tax=Sulfitobacter aestuarii TaxID=2161676 RepID=A0ABW5U3C8_9RHOB
MNKVVLAALAGMMLSACTNRDSANFDAPGRYEVTGVEEGEMLKLRAGPGTGYVALLGLPNGSVLQVYSCQPVGGTRWCEARLEGAGQAVGHVSRAYLRKL